MVQALLQPPGRGTGAGVIAATQPRPWCRCYCSHPAPALVQALLQPHIPGTSAGVIAATLAVSSLVSISESPLVARIKTVKRICLSTEERSAASPGGRRTHEEPHGNDINLLDRQHPRTLFNVRVNKLHKLIQHCTPSSTSAALLFRRTGMALVGKYGTKAGPIPVDSGHMFMIMKGYTARR